MTSRIIHGYKGSWCHGDSTVTMVTNSHHHSDSMLHVLWENAITTDSIHIVRIYYLSALPWWHHKKHCSITDMLKEHTLYNSTMWNNNAHIQGDLKCTRSIFLVRMANPCVDSWSANVWNFG